LNPGKGQACEGNIKEKLLRQKSMQKGSTKTTNSYRVTNVITWGRGKKGKDQKATGCQGN